MAASTNTKRILIAGFGGQGVLFLGKLLAYVGMAEEKQVSWLPSYGPEMRGGTANCSVILSDEPIGSPIVSEPDVLIAMNLPSFQKYQPKVVSGGAVVLDSTLIHEAPARKDVSYYALPATQMATDENLDGLGNMILLGKLLESCLDTDDTLAEKALAKVVPAKKAHLLDANKKAIALGRAYQR